MTTSTTLNPGNPKSVVKSFIGIRSALLFLAEKEYTVSDAFFTSYDDLFNIPY
jgi:hypothetical protein